MAFQVEFWPENRWNVMYFRNNCLRRHVEEGGRWFGKFARIWKIMKFLQLGRDWVFDGCM